MKHISQMGNGLGEMTCPMSYIQKGVRLSDTKV